MNIYDKHDNAFPTVSAFVIVTKSGDALGKVAFKHGARVTAFVHIYGQVMVSGWAGGGGYDRASAAVAEAARKITFPDDSLKYSNHPRLAQRAAKVMQRDNNQTWEGELRDIGLNVLQAV